MNRQIGSFIVRDDGPVRDTFDRGEYQDVPVTRQRRLDCAPASGSRGVLVV